MVRYEREAQFHDAKVASMEIVASPPACPDPWVAAMLQRAGDVRAKRVLELGCGTGDLAIQLACAGANLTVLDVSRRSVEMTCARVNRFADGASIKATVAPAEATTLATSSFDLILGNCVIHHLDVESASAEIARLLVPSGEAVFVETSGLNPILMLARRYLVGRLGIPRFGTEDEHPLAKADFATFQRHFRQVELVFPAFLFLEMFDRQVLRYRYRWASRVLNSLDAVIDRYVPKLRRYSWLFLLRVAEPIVPESEPQGGIKQLVS